MYTQTNVNRSIAGNPKASLVAALRQLSIQASFSGIGAELAIGDREPAEGGFALPGLIGLAVACATVEGAT
jgi:hypothetical protein